MGLPLTQGTPWGGSDLRPHSPIYPPRWSCRVVRVFPSESGQATLIPPTFPSSQEWRTWLLHPPFLFPKEAREGALRKLLGGSREGSS